MSRYFRLLKDKLYICILITLGCAMLGSVLGARKESNEPLNGITQEEIELMERDDMETPELIGIFPLAVSQNNWYNFQYAFIFAAVGMALYCILMAVYMPLYHLQFFVIIRKLLGEEGENYLFVKTNLSGTDSDHIV